MKADVYTGFLTDKVKVFGTERRAKPFVLPGKVLRRVTPFLLASAMTLTACSPKQNQEEKENNGQHVDYTEIYHDVVDRYNLTVHSRIAFAAPAGLGIRWVRSHGDAVGLGK